jgi:zinc protease
LAGAVADVVKNGVSADELDKAKVESRMAIIHQGRETAEQLAGQLGDEALFANDPNRVNAQLDKLNAVTSEQIKAVAGKYLAPAQATTLYMKPDPLGTAARAAASTQAAAVKDAPVAASTRDVEPRAVQFPADYPQHPPLHDPGASPEFQKGTELAINGVKVVVMPDHRLPLAHWSLAIRHGSFNDPSGKEGLASLTANLMARGAADLNNIQLGEDLESRGISLSVTDERDHLTLHGDCPVEQLDHGILRSHQVLLQPLFDPEEFANFKQQRINELFQRQGNPDTVAKNDLDRALYGLSVLGRYANPGSVDAITLDDVKAFYATYVRPEAAVLVLSGDLDLERGKALAAKLLEGWKAGEVPPEVEYPKSFAETGRRVILVDRPDAPGCTIHIGAWAYDLHSDEKFAGSLMGQILSAGIDGRLMKYVRAEKGLAYGCYGYFNPERHGGQFTVITSVAPPLTVDAIDAIFKVLDDVRNADVTAEELASAKLRVAGMMAMETQSVQQQAQRRMEGILNDYPVDYYDKYSSRVAVVMAQQARQVMEKYVDPQKMTIVVVGPAAELATKLAKFGEVIILPMPAKRSGSLAGSGPPELLHAAAPATQDAATQPAK